MNRIAVSVVRRRLNRSCASVRSVVLT